MIDRLRSVAVAVHGDRVFVGRLRVGGVEVGGQIGQSDLVLRPARAGDGWFNRRQVELERLVELRPRTGLAPQRVLLGVGLDERHLLRRAPGHAQVGQGFVIDREERRGRAVLGRHVGDRRPVGQRQ